VHYLNLNVLAFNTCEPENLESEVAARFLKPPFMKYEGPAFISLQKVQCCLVLRQNLQESLLSLLKSYQIDNELGVALNQMALIKEEALYIDWLQKIEAAIE